MHTCVPGTVVVARCCKINDIPQGSLLRTDQGKFTVESIIFIMGQNNISWVKESNFTLVNSTIKNLVFNICIKKHCIKIHEVKIVRKCKDNLV